MIVDDVLLFQERPANTHTVHIWKLPHVMGFEQLGVKDLAQGHLSRDSLFYFHFHTDLS